MRESIRSRRGLADELRRNAALYAVIAAFFGATWLLASYQGESFLPFLRGYVIRALRGLFLIASIFMLAVALRAILRARTVPIMDTVRESLGYLRQSPFITRFLFASAVLSIFMAAFLFNKMQIPHLRPFDWDQTFFEWDRMLFAGNDPWRILHPLVGWPVVTIAIDFLYSLWVPLVFVFWAGLYASPAVDSSLRVRFWASTVAAWILLGLVSATFLSSVGPCYFADIVPGDASPYRDLVAYLDGVNAGYPLASSSTKAYLWSIHTGLMDAPGGISAMPSMHNAQAVLFAAAAYGIRRWLGHIFAAYGVVIFVGSIHLGWHYAVDGIAGAAGAFAIWYAVSAVASRRLRRAGEMPATAASA